VEPPKYESGTPFSHVIHTVKMKGMWFGKRLVSS
jgi:hypothetical protein